MTKTVYYGDAESITRYYLSDFLSMPYCVVMKMLVLIFMMVAPVLSLQQIRQRCKVLGSLVVVSHSQKWIHLQTISMWVFTVLIVIVELKLSLFGLIYVSKNLLCFPFLHTLENTTMTSASLIIMTFVQTELFVKTLSLNIKLIRNVYRSMKAAVHPTFKKTFTLVAMKIALQVKFKLLFWFPFVILVLQTFKVTHLTEEAMTGLIMWTFLLHTIIQPIITMFL